MKSITLSQALLSLLTTFFLSTSVATRADDGIAPPLQDMELMICFQGKGASLAYDGGVLRESLKRIPSLKNHKSIVSGNSSGSILAAYFSCFGFSDASIANCDYKLLHGDRTVVRKMQNGKLLAFKSLAGKKTELDHIEMKEFVAFALGVENFKHLATLEDVARCSTAVPKYPMLIVAGNREVLFDRGKGDLLAARNYKVFDSRDWSVSWHPEVYEFYKNHPDRFAKDHPDLILGDSPYIGKAVTYFVNRSMYDLLRQIPEHERTGDLRLVETPQDVLMAIMASVSEPTYFDPYAENNPSKLLCKDVPGDLGNTRNRSYCGGAFSNLPAQDVRRTLPGIRVLGTGYSTVPYAGRELIRNWYMTDIEYLARLSGWWSDMELQQTEEVRNNMIKSRNLPPETEFDLGAQMAKESYDRVLDLPKYVTPPFYGDVAAAALMPNQDAADVWETTSENQRRLKTKRGLGPLLLP